LISKEEHLASLLVKQEDRRAVYWNRYDPFVDLRMKWRASMMRHLFHILPGQRILEIGAGNGEFTRSLLIATREECKITTVVFSLKYRDEIREKLNNNNVDIVCLDSFPGTLQGEKFDCVITNHMLGDHIRNEFLCAVKQLIRPGGGFLLFEPNPWNYYYHVRKLFRRLLPIPWSRPADPISINRIEVFSVFSEIGYTQINVLPYDFLYSPIPKFLVWPAQNLSIIMENFPYFRNLAGSLYIWAHNPSLKDEDKTTVDLCYHQIFFGKVSFVIPCHNEEMNVAPLIEGITDFYDKYVFEILIVDDNSTDRTAEVTEKLAEKYKCVHLIKRSPPNGVGRALREGLKAAKGEYILIMDSDFQHIIPEIRDLFDAVADGADVVVGSRFSRESVLVNYAFTKILANRAFHVIANILLGRRFRDISNNLKIFRHDVAKRLVIETDDFAANVETGLKPILLGYRVVEVPISWVNRSIDMGLSTFQIFKTGPNYWKILLRLVWRRITKQPCQKEMGKYAE
jgi:SAM-dependent methyltransferase